MSRRPKNAPKVGLVFARDGGICQLCGIDCTELRRALDAMPATDRGEIGAAMGIPAQRRRKGNRLWDVDHIVPLAVGGSNELENLRTLCIPCHRAITAAFNEEQAAKMLATAI